MGWTAWPERLVPGPKRGVGQSVTLSYKSLFRPAALPAYSAAAAVSDPSQQSKSARARTV